MTLTIVIVHVYEAQIFKIITYNYCNNKVI